MLGTIYQQLLNEYKICDSVGVSDKVLERQKKQTKSKSSRLLVILVIYHSFTRTVCLQIMIIPFGSKEGLSLNWNIHSVMIMLYFVSL